MKTSGLSSYIQIPKEKKNAVTFSRGREWDKGVSLSLFHTQRHVLAKFAASEVAFLATSAASG